MHVHEHWKCVFLYKFAKLIVNYFVTVQTAMLIQDLSKSKSELEKQLHQKSEESLLMYQKVSELTDEKNVLVDIIEHLCVEAGKLIDVV